MEEKSSVCARKLFREAKEKFSNWPAVLWDIGWRIYHPLVKACEISTDPCCALEKAVEERLGDGVAWSITSDPAESLNKVLALNKRLKKKSKNGRAVLASWNAEVRQQGNGPAFSRAEEAANGKAFWLRGIGQQRQPQVPAVKT